MKETVLTNADLGDYAYSDGYNTMEYTWTETCHNANHGYSSSNKSNCDNTNSYATSKVKEMLEGSYINTLGANNLKEVDGYKIRLITLEELQQNLGVSTKIHEDSYDVDYKNTPTWVYKNFEAQSKDVYGYWSMAPVPDTSDGVWFAVSEGTVYYHGIHDHSFGVRPVINLLKSNIS